MLNAERTVETPDAFPWTRQSPCTYSRRLFQFRNRFLSGSERNRAGNFELPGNAGLARSARRWRWSSLGRATLGLPGPPLETGPVAKPERWQEWVDQPETEAELTALRRSVARGVPFGAESWQRQTAKRLGLESSLRPVGRPSRAEKVS